VVLNVIVITLSIVKKQKDNIMKRILNKWSIRGLGGHVFANGRTEKMVIKKAREKCGGLVFLFRNNEMVRSVRLPYRKGH
jgi:hypothetical protein